jgi:hypothetical protein
MDALFSPYELAAIDLMHNQDEATRRKLAETLHQMLAIWQGGDT